MPTLTGNAMSWSFFISKRNNHSISSNNEICEQTKTEMCEHILTLTGQYLNKLSGIDLIKLFSLLWTDGIEIRCAGTSVLEYSGVLYLPRGLRQNSHNLFQNKKEEHYLHILKYFYRLFCSGGIQSAQCITTALK